MPQTELAELETEFLSDDALLAFIDELIMFSQWELVTEAKWLASQRGLII